MPTLLALPWPTFVNAIKDIPEEECWTQLALEKKGKNRLVYLQRLYGRANLLRSQRERREWFGD